MAAAAQPIALPAHPHSNSEHNDYPMAPSSLSGQNNSFNPASYRRFMGSPMSFRAGSFGSRFYPGVSPGQLFGPLDPNDFRFGKMSSSIESDRGSLINNALNVFDRQDEFCRDYQCCGVNLNDMHALVDHFEECHVVVVDPYAAPLRPSHSPPASSSSPLSSSPTQQTPRPPSHDPHAASQSQSQSTSQSQAYFPSGQYHQGSFDPDDMELDLDGTTTGGPSAPSSGASSPPDTPVSTPLSAYAYAGAPVSAFETTTVLPSRVGAGYVHGRGMGGVGGMGMGVGGGGIGSGMMHMGMNMSGMINGGMGSGMALRAEDAFNAYAGYADYSSMLPGTAEDTPGGAGAGAGVAGGQYRSCVTPALLLNSAATSPADTPGSSRVASPVGYAMASQSSSQPQSQPAATQAHASSSRPTLAASTSTSSAPSSSTAPTHPQIPRISTTLSRPATSLLLSKPFKCPKPNCNKSYKQANGLKYHMTHGSCNFAPPKDLEAIQALLASKRRELSLSRAAAAAAANGSSSGTGGSGQGMGSGGAGQGQGQGIGAGPDDALGLSLGLDLGEMEISLSEAEMREVEREAERRLRPYACGVGECQRRYKNMNGLRYHYQHSGDHGAIGLSLLASGQHECLQHTRSRHGTPARRASPPSASASASASAGNVNASHVQSPLASHGNSPLASNTSSAVPSPRTSPGAGTPARGSPLAQSAVAHQQPQLYAQGSPHQQPQQAYVQGSPQQQQAYAQQQQAQYAQAQSQQYAQYAPAQPSHAQQQGQSPPHSYAHAQAQGYAGAQGAYAQ